MWGAIEPLRSFSSSLEGRSLRQTESIENTRIRAPEAEWSPHFD
jgi:hypothetical protein